MAVSAGAAQAGLGFWLSGWAGRSRLWGGTRFTFMILMNFRSSRSLSCAFSCNMIIDRTLQGPRAESRLSCLVPIRPLVVLLEMGYGRRTNLRPHPQCAQGSWGTRHSPSLCPPGTRHPGEEATHQGGTRPADGGAKQAFLIRAGRAPRVAAGLALETSHTWATWLALTECTQNLTKGQPRTRTSWWPRAHAFTGPTAGHGEAVPLLCFLSPTKDACTEYTWPEL